MLSKLGTIDFWAMNLKNQLTRTPYLVLFMVLISVGIGTASALVTITLAGDVIVTDGFTVDTDTLIVDSVSNRVGIGQVSPSQKLDVNGDMLVRGDLRVGTNDPNNDDFIFFDDGTETLMWQNTNSQFELSDGLLANGDLITTTDVEGEAFVIGPSNSGDNDFIFFDFISEHLVWDDAVNRFEFSNDLGIGTDLGTDNDFIYFDSGTSRWLAWDNAQTRFEFNDELSVNGPINTGVSTSIFPYNSIGATSASAADISNVLDLSVSDSLEVGDDIYLGRSEGDSDIKFFDGGVSDGERIQWDDSADAFEVSDDFTVFGKLTAASIDPAYISYSGETHDSIKQMSLEVSDHEDVMQFWNKDNNRFEVYVIAQDTFYTFEGKEVKYLSTGIPENSAINRLAEFEEQEKIRKANPEVGDPEPETEE